MEKGKERYAVLSYIIGKNYEKIHPIKEKSDRATYVMITDNPDLVDESNTWKVICDNTLSGSTFDKCYQIRFNPFKYVNEKILLRIDGSVGVESNLDPLIDRFIEGGYEASFMLHPTRANLYDEYVAWITQRGYPAQQASHISAFLQQLEGYDVKKNNGLLQMCYSIQINDKYNTDFNLLNYAFLKYLGDAESGIERVDKTISSFILAKYFNNTFDKIMWTDTLLMQSKFFTWYAHGTNTPFGPVDPSILIEPTFGGRPIENVLKRDEL